MDSPRLVTRARFLLGALFVPLWGLTGTTSARADSSGCPSDCAASCVLYVRSRTGLPGGRDHAAEYTEQFMKTLGWYRVVPPGNGSIPAAGGVMVMDAGKKYADSQDGHMAFVRSDPTYDYKNQLWTVSVDQANWICCRIDTNYTFTGRDSNTGVTWGDLDGINFYLSGSGAQIDNPYYSCQNGSFPCT